MYSSRRIKKLIKDIRELKESTIGQKVSELEDKIKEIEEKQEAVLSKEVKTE